MQIKTTLRYLCTTNSLANIKILDDTTCKKLCGEKENVFCYGRNKNLYFHFGDQQGKWKFAYLPEKKIYKTLAFLASCEDEMQVFDPVCQTDASAPNFESEDGVKKQCSSRTPVVRVAPATEPTYNFWRQQWL